MHLNPEHIMPQPHDKTIMRSLGEFFGHIVRGVRTNPEDTSEVREVSRRVEEESRGDVVMRRTTVEEIEIRKTRDEHEANSASKRDEQH
jgi:hypothetical protein